LNFTVTGTGSGQTATVSLTIFFQDYSLTATPSGTTVTAGNKATYAVTVTPTNGFDQVVLLSCGPIPQDTTCYWNPPALTMAGTTGTGTVTATSTLTITTTAQSKLLRPPPPRSIPPGWGRWILLLALLTLLGAIATSFRRSGSWARPRLSLVVLLVALFLVALEVGCENYVNPININPVVTGTPSGTVGIVLTGTLGNNSGVTRYTIVNLSVLPTT
jgi:hypothetical protein